jgi:hypothetical protein
MKNNLYNDNELVTHVTNSKQPMVIASSYTFTTNKNEERTKYNCEWVNKKGNPHSASYFEEALKPYKEVSK